MELMNMGIKRDALSNDSIIAFQNLPNNIKIITEEYFDSKEAMYRYKMINLLSDEIYNRYRVRRIEVSFLPFVNFRSDLYLVAAF